MNKNTESLSLAEEILKDIELGTLSISSVVPKVLRLARLRGDTNAIEWLRLEMSGYTSTPDGIPPTEWAIGAYCKRYYQEKDKSGIVQTYMRYESVGRIETEIESAKMQLQVSVDPNISVSSANPSQYVFSPHGNTFERSGLRSSIIKWTSVLDKIKSALYEYVLQIYYQLKFGDISETVFERKRNFVNARLADMVPTAIKELVSAYDNLKSDNESDWSNATNSCRRLLKEAADVLFPADPDNKKTKDGHKLTDQEYKNRLIEYVKSKDKSKSFERIVGSQLSYLTNRLDALNEYHAKGVHEKVTREEAETLVIYTYLIAGDILSLTEPNKVDSKPEVETGETKVNSKQTEND